MPETVEARELPIPFDRPENIVALVKGEKTQTRRPIKPQPLGGPRGNHGPTWAKYEAAPDEWEFWGPKDPETGRALLYEHGVHKPQYNLADLLWVREALVRRGPLWYYKADGRPVIPALADREAMVAWAHDKGSNHCTSRYMPRIAARIFLRVTDVRAERLWDINEAQARAEGVMFDGQWWLGGIHKIKGSFQCWPTARDAFRALWNTMHADKATQWAKNPWVWAYTFTVNVVDRM